MIPACHHTLCHGDLISVTNQFSIIMCEHSTVVTFTNTLIERTRIHGKYLYVFTIVSLVHLCWFIVETSKALLLEFYQHFIIIILFKLSYVSC